MSARPPEALPHQNPFRFVERTEEIDGGRVAIVLGTAGGTMTGSDPWPIGLVAEALAQAILLVVRPDHQASLRLVALDGVGVFQPITAGDRLEVEVRETGAFGDLRRYACRARRGGGVAAVAEVTVRA
ncbi:MAG: hypothetical protein ABR961_10390 [Thermoanaerobaculaceae bacterium]